MHSSGSVQARNFIVVIDPGHGGKDPGALGKETYEKHINLNVSLKLGKLIEENCPDVKVIYTRQTDIFLPLDDRPAIANVAKADLFISIHTNSIDKPKTLRGASTWTLGLARSAANLEVAKRENAVILYESDYKTRYAGFDPTSAESYIIFEFMQDKYMSQSVHLADLIQKQFKNTCNRVDYGVHQAEFLVLRRTAMPSVLVELGFISNLDEERFLSSELGAATMARGIYQAFLQYKKEHDQRMSGTTAITPTTPVETKPAEQKPAETKPAETKPKPAEAKPIESVTINAPNKPATKPKPQNPKGGLLFMVQIITANHELDKNDYRIKNLHNVSYYMEDGYYKYTCGGATPDYNQAVEMKNKLLFLFKDAFVVAFRNGEKVNMNQATEEFTNNQK